MRRSRFITLAAGAAAVAAGVATRTTAHGADAADPLTAQATIRNASGTVLGTLALRQIRPTTVQVSVRLAHLSAGFHGFHVHAVGVCDPAGTDPAGNPAPFTTAGPHADPGGAGHGGHAGDLPPLLVLAPGTVSRIEETDRLTVASLFDADGSAVIVHALPDNLANIPTRYISATTGLPGPDAVTLNTGDAGARTGCGVLVRR